jgi:hypothetical protein
MRTPRPSLACGRAIRRICLALGLLLMLTTPASAQTDSLTQGARLRLDIVTLPPDVQVVGTLIAVRRDSLLVRVDPNPAVPDDSLFVPLNLILDMSVSQGMGHAGGLGAGVGTFVGFLGMGGIGFATASNICSALDNQLYPEICEPQSKRYTHGLVFGLAGAAAGGVLGYLVGSRVARERWRPLVVEGMRAAGAALESGRTAFSVTLRF